MRESSLYLLIGGRQTLVVRAVPSSALDDFYGVAGRVLNPNRSGTTGYRSGTEEARK